MTEPSRPGPSLPLTASVPGTGFSTPAYNFYEAVGGHETFVKLVDVFYDGVAEDPLMRPSTAQGTPPAVP